MPIQQLRHSVPERDFGLGAVEAADRFRPTLKSDAPLSQPPLARSRTHSRRITSFSCVKTGRA